MQDDSAAPEDVGHVVSLPRTRHDIPDCGRLHPGAAGLTGVAVPRMLILP
jgi:hypothetical protein